MSQKFISQTGTVIPEVSSEDASDEYDVEELNSPINKEKDKLLIASLDLIDKKKRESFVHNLRLSIKDPMVDISNKDLLSDTHSKIELMKMSRKDIEFQIEQKALFLFLLIKIRCFFIFFLAFYFGKI